MPPVLPSRARITDSVDLPGRVASLEHRAGRSAERPLQPHPPLTATRRSRSRRSPREGPNVGLTMTSQPASDGLFESFRRAEMLIARSRPLDALQALGPVLESQPNDVSVQLLAGRAYLNSAQLRLAEQAFVAGPRPRPRRPLRALRAGQGAAAAGPARRGARPAEDGGGDGPAPGVPGGARRGAGPAGDRRGPALRAGRTPARADRSGMRAEAPFRPRMIGR